MSTIDHEGAADPLRVDAGELAAPRFFQSLADQIWAVQSHAVLREMAQIAQRQGNLEAVHRRRGQRAEDAYGVEIRDGVAIVPIMGPIFPRANLFTELSGATSISTLAQDLQRMLERTDIKAVLLDIDSPGGVVTGVDEMASIIKEIAGQKPVTAYVGGTAASAAYWLAAAAREIVVTRTGQVGSIGVVATIPKQQAPDDMGVMDFEIVSSNAPDKRPDPESDAGRRAVLERIDEIERLFIDSVAANRGVDREAVLRDFGRGNVMVGGVAVRRKMADRIGTFEDTLAGLHEQTADDGAAASAASLQAPERKEDAMSDEGTKTAEAQAAADTDAGATPETPAGTTAASPSPAAKTMPAADVIQACQDAKVPGLAGPLVRESATAEQVKTRVDQAKLVRDVCASFGRTDMADTLVEKGMSADDAKALLGGARDQGVERDAAIGTAVPSATGATAGPAGDHGWGRAAEKVAALYAGPAR